MCRDIGGIVGRSDRLVVAGGVERQLGDQLAVCVDHADVLVGDQELDRATFVRLTDADVRKLARIAT
jgi:hypothetical protein